jgi:ABC-type multidrug transport system ATPase subunit
LSGIAARNAAVLCTIHQPSSDVFVLFDLAIFMKAGRVIYCGPVTDIITNFSIFGYNCPTNYNPADYVMLLAQTESIEQLEKSGLIPDANKQADLIREEVSACEAGTADFHATEFQASFFKVFYLFNYFTYSIYSFINFYFLANESFGL